MTIRSPKKKELLRASILDFINSYPKDKLIFSDYGKKHSRAKACSSYEITKNTIGYSRLKSILVDIEIEKLVKENVLISISWEPPLYVRKTEYDSLLWNDSDLFSKEKSKI